MVGQSRASRDCVSVLVPIHRNHFGRSGPVCLAIQEYNECAGMREDGHPHLPISRSLWKGILGNLFYRERVPQGLFFTPLHLRKYSMRLLRQARTFSPELKYRDKPCPRRPRLELSLDGPSSLNSPSTSCIRSKARPFQTAGPPNRRSPICPGYQIRKKGIPSG
jgi:hypothetical protein